MIWMKLFIAILLLLILLAAWAVYTNFTPPLLGVSDGKLAPCPSSPNCVSSQSTVKSHYIDPLTLKSGSLKPIEQIIARDPHAKIVRKTKDYLRAEYKTPLGFRDDVEFYVNREKNVIDVRSSSRVGYSDLGVNRRRIEKIREQLANEALP